MTYPRTRYRPDKADPAATLAKVLTFALPMPPASLSPNARVHWAVRSRDTKRYRRTVAQTVWEQHGRSVLPHWERARLDLVFVFSTKRPRDADNLRTRFKAGQDQLVMLGIVPDDNTACLEAGSTTVEIRPGVPHVVATLTRLDTGEGQG